MGKWKSEREKKLQRMLIPLNLIICIICAVAIVTLFITPFVSFDVGKVLRDEGVMAFVDEKVDNIIGDTIEGTDQEDIDYKPVVAVLVKQILGKAEGEVSISGIGAFHVLTGSGDKTQMVMDDLLFGEDALATSLINSIVDGVAEIFETDEGKALLEDALVSTMTQGVIKSVDDETVVDALTKENVKELVGIFKDLGNPEKVPEGKVDEVAGRFIDKIDTMLGDEINLDEADRQNLIAQVQEMYDETSGYLAEGEAVSVEAIMCVTLSKNVDLSQINIEDLFSGMFGSSDAAVHIDTVDEIIDDGTGEGGDDTGGEEQPPENVVVTNYDDLLLQIGYDKAKKEELKESMRVNLNAELDKMIKDNGIDKYMGYYGYITFVMLAFMLPWIFLFLFSFFHMLAKNKRFTMWYVKLFGWIPAVIWVAVKLLPIIAPKISRFNEIWNGKNGALIQAAVASTGTFNWISGICYILIWLLSIFWAFPIKHKIRKERKNPQNDEGDYDDEY